MTCPEISFYWNLSLCPLVNKMVYSIKSCFAELVLDFGCSKIGFWLLDCEHVCNIDFAIRRDSLG